MIGLIQRNFNYFDKNTFLTLYKALVRPYLEYAQCIWFPYKKMILSIENVQHRANKIIKKILNVWPMRKDRDILISILLYIGGHVMTWQRRTKL